MLCDKCKRRDASVHITQEVNGMKSEHHLCEECARQEMGMMHGGHSASPMERLWGALRSLGVVGVVVAPQMTPDAVHGREVDLDELGLHLPGSAEPDAGENVLSLKAELESAVNSENFERAAELRDQIYKLEHQN